MLTDSEIGTIDSLTDQARRAVEALEAKATGLWGWITRDDAHRAASVARTMFDDAIVFYNSIKDSPEDKHEEALQIVERFKNLITPGWVENATSNPTAAEITTGVLDKAAGVIGQGLRKIGIDPQGVTKWVKILIVVVGLVAVAYVFGILAPLIPRRRHA